MYKVSLTIQRLLSYMKDYSWIRNKLWLKPTDWKDIDSCCRSSDNPDFKLCALHGVGTWTVVFQPFCSEKECPFLMLSPLPNCHLMQMWWLIAIFQLGVWKCNGSNFAGESQPTRIPAHTILVRTEHVHS